ncbi:Hypothetical predicted protein [Paramuricea clavata]|uniref:Uncharacterized protein n=1 Tax=Paramuricea clavata TaxID=317549 RepID=A0A6S7JAS7_PARCT|nr:Hypothetical predicted protein [Paramuricea clavata]
MSVSLVYYAVSYGSVDLGWNPYLTFALTGVIEFPSNFGAVWAADSVNKYNLPNYNGSICKVFHHQRLLMCTCLDGRDVPNIRKIRIHTMLPFGIMAFFCLQSSIVAMLLPETNGQATLETIQDMEPKSVPTLKEIGKDNCIAKENFELG